MYIDWKSYSYYRKIFILLIHIRMTSYARVHSCGFRTVRSRTFRPRRLVQRTFGPEDVWSKGRLVQKAIWSKGRLVQRPFGPKCRLVQRTFGLKAVWSKERLVQRPFGPKDFSSKGRSFQGRFDQNMNNLIFNTVVHSSP